MAFNNSDRTSSFSSLSSSTADQESSAGIQLAPLRSKSRRGRNSAEFKQAETNIFDENVSGLFDISWDTTDRAHADEELLTDIESLLTSRPYEKTLSADTAVDFDFSEFLNEKEIGLGDRLSSSTLGSLDTHFQGKDFFSSDSDVAFSSEEMVTLPTADCTQFASPDWSQQYAGMPGGFQSLYPSPDTHLDNQWSASLLTDVVEPAFPASEMFGVPPILPVNGQTEWYSSTQEYQARYPLSANLQCAGKKAPTKAQEKKKKTKGTLPAKKRKLTGLGEMTKRNDSIRRHAAEAKECRDREEAESATMMETLKRLMSR